jgi:protein SSD1
MTDQAPTPSQSKDEKKPATSNTSNQNVNKGGQKKNPNRPNNPGQGRRKPSSANESGSDTGGGRKGNDNTNRRTSDNRGKSQGGRGGNQKNRIPSQSRPSNSTNGQSGNRQASKSNSSTPAPATGAETSDALSSLQRIIADLKTASPAVQPYAIQQTEIVSSLPADAPVFRPGMQAWPGLTQSNDQAKHRKAASVGTSHSNNTIGSYSPNLGVMMEDPEDGPVPYEPGEIHGDPGFRQQQQAHNRRSLSQSFSAPRFAALAQQDQGDGLGPTGRPQLAPGFIFGAAGSRRRGSTHGPVGPPINEEDIGFQFPQQQIQGPSRHDDGGEITGIMAEQVNHLRRRNSLSIAEFLQIAIQKQIEALQQQQQALYQQQLASNQILSSQNPGFTPNRPSAHRRVQSTVPVGISGGNNIFGAQNPMGQLGNLNGLGMGLDGQTAGIPRGHGRRHSVNVLNKAVGQSIGSFEDGGFEPFDDGFNLPGQQQRGAYPESFLCGFNSFRLGAPTSITHSNNFAQDLAQAQAQLTSLQQFRAASGGHHHKMPSFSFPNMLPNMMAANMMGLGSGVNFLQQQAQQFQSQLQQQSNQPQRKSLFAPYLPQASLPPLLAAGKLVVGILRVNKRNRSDAYVSTEVLDADIYICGSKDRNRALEGDIVAVELLDVDEVWATKKEKEEKKRKKEENSAYESKSAAGRKNDKKKDDVEVEGQGLMLFEDEEVTDDVKPQFAGHVVAVVERMPGQLFSGTLGLLRPSSAATKEKQEAERREREGDRGDEPRRPIERPKIVWFKPTDKRVPLIAIPTEQAPTDFVQNPEAYANKLFVACIKRHVSPPLDFPIFSSETSCFL